MRGASRVAVAVSGGPDSMALVLLASAWASMRGIGLDALTVDHGLRPESAAEARRVAGWMAARGISHHVLAWTERPRGNVQAEARCTHPGRGSPGTYIQARARVRFTRTARRWNAAGSTRVG